MSRPYGERDIGRKTGRPSSRPPSQSPPSIARLVSGLIAVIFLAGCDLTANLAPAIDDLNVELKMEGSTVPIYTTDLAYNPEEDDFYLYYSTCDQSGKLIRYDRHFTTRTDLLTSGQIFPDPTACVDLFIASRGSKIYIYQDLYLATLTINAGGTVTVDRVTQLNGWGGVLTARLGRDLTPTYFQCDDDGNVYFTDIHPYPDSYELFKYTPSTYAVTSVLQDGLIEAETGLDHSYFVLHQVDSEGYEGSDLASGVYLKISSSGTRILDYIGFFPESFVAAGARLGDMRIFFNDWRVNVDDFTAIERENLGGGYERFTTDCETFVTTNGAHDQFICAQNGTASIAAAAELLPGLTEGGPDTRRMIETGSSVVFYDYYYGQIWEITP